MGVFNNSFFVTDVTIEIPSLSTVTQDGVETPGAVSTHPVKASVEPIRSSRDLDAEPGAALLIGGRRFYMNHSAGGETGVKELVKFFDEGAGGPTSFTPSAKILHDGVTYIVQDVMTWEGEYVEVLGSRQTVG